jgi:hypothetical protein
MTCLSRYFDEFLIEKELYLVLNTFRSKTKLATKNETFKVKQLKSIRSEISLLVRQCLFSREYPTTCSHHLIGIKRMSFLTKFCCKLNHTVYLKVQQNNLFRPIYHRFEYDAVTLIFNRTVHAKTAIIRIKMQKTRLEEQIKRQKQEVVNIMENGKEELARIRVIE